MCFANNIHIRFSRKIIHYPLSHQGTFMALWTEVFGGNKYSQKGASAIPPFWSLPHPDSYSEEQGGTLFPDNGYSETNLVASGENHQSESFTQLLECLPSLDWASCSISHTPSPTIIKYHINLWKPYLWRRTN